MESLDRLNGFYGNISALLKACKSRFAEIEGQRFEKTREKALKESIMNETNRQLKEAASVFFDEYENVKNALCEAEQNAGRIDRIPVGSPDDETERRDEETETLRRIEEILERQEFIGKLERLPDDEVANLYQGALAKAERLRKSLTSKVETGELHHEDAQRILRMDANVRISAMMEDYEYPVTGKRLLQDRLGRMISAAKEGRIRELTDSKLKAASEQLHSSVCFLLRDLSESSLKIRDWENAETIISDPDCKQVEFFLSQSEKYISSTLAENSLPVSDGIFHDENQQAAEAGQ